jgi:DNA polymerase-3 subunit delta'
MLFSDILGQDHIKKHLTKTVDQGRIAHAQLFVGPEGSGTLPMALAYAQYVLCGNINGENTGGNSSCNLKFENFAHPDLHFAFPVAKKEGDKTKNPTSKNYLSEWRKLLDDQPYGNLFDWYKMLGVEKKQGNISVHEAADIYKGLSLKSHEGGYKVLIMWMAEKMNTECANKLLKLIEEPPEKTLIILIVENEELLLETIRSRCQIIQFSLLSEVDITNGLIKNYQLNESVAKKIAHQSNGNYNKACDLVYHDSEDTQFEEWFIYWIRSAFKAKGNKTAIHNLISWSEDIAKTGRETQKQFLQFCLSYFRQAMLLNFNAPSLVYIEPQIGDFKLEKFAPFIHEENILSISEELQDAIYHIERNGNSKIILTDLSIKLTRLLHKKAS